MKKMIDITCIYCCKDVCKDCPLYEYSLDRDYACVETNRNTKQYFHLSCAANATKANKPPEPKNIFPSKKKSCIQYNMECPFCNISISYWPNCSERTCSDYGNVIWTKTKRNTKQFAHLSCFKNTRRNVL